MGLDRLVDIAVSQSIIDETLRVMNNKFFTSRPLAGALFIMATLARMAEPAGQVKAVRDDPNDDHVVSCAIAAGAEAVITGDKHLLRMSSYEGIKMLRLGEFLRRGQGKR
jgi:putative PIN family toxin of toxin-antitoxin system